MAKLKIIYNHMNKWAFWICLGISVFLLITAFFVPPTAEISPSVLGGVSELFAFASLSTVIAAIEKGVDASVKHGETELNITNPDSQTEGK